MIMKRLISVAIAFAMLAVSFAMVSSNVKAQTTDSDNSTQITVNAVFPKLYWIGFNGTNPYPNLLENQVLVNADYIFAFEYNYSLGFAQCDFIVQAWHDRGVLNSNYPATGNNVRNLAFEIRCNSTTWDTFVNFPAGGPELTSAGPAVAIPRGYNTLNPSQDLYLVYIPVHFGNQIRAAEYGGVAPISPGFSRIKATALNNVNTWDFSIRAFDRVQTSASNTSWGEFGIQRTVAISVSGNPTGNAPPGGSTILSPATNIVYSSNTPYFVNVTLADNLLLNGVGPVNIPTTSIRVRNNHPDVTAGNSEIPASTIITAPLADRYVWGLPGTNISAAGNGTTSAGPMATNYWGFPSTDLIWSVNVPAIQEGIYWTRIVVSIDG
jgi:hypothetical protein